MYRTLLLTLVVIGVMASSAIAAVPLLISYQGILTDSLGDPVADGAYMIKFIVWDDPTATGAPANFLPQTQRSCTTLLKFSQIFILNPNMKDMTKSTNGPV